MLAGEQLPGEQLAGGPVHAGEVQEVQPPAWTAPT
jgi:hypothetical protein